MQLKNFYESNEKGTTADCERKLVEYEAKVIYIGNEESNSLLSVAIAINGVEYY